MGRHYDAAVIGGGLLGTAAAYYLARDGAAVVLLEKDELNGHASGQNAGSLHFQLEFRMVEHGASVAAQFARQLPLVLEAQRMWGLLEAELGERIEVTQSGGLMCAETDADVQLLRQKHELEQSWGLATELLEQDAVREHAPYLTPTVRAAGYCRLEGHANPRLVGPAFARAATRAGTDLRTRSRVVRLRRDGTRWRVELVSGEWFEADTVLIAAGIWSAEVGRMADVCLPIVPVALSMIVTESTRPIVPHLVQHIGRRLSLKQAHDGNLLIGGGWPSRLVQRHGVVDLDSRPELLLDRLAGNAWTGIHVVPALAGLQVLRAWSGIAPVVADQLPLLGAIPRRPGLFVATGGPGFTLGPVLAKTVAAIMAAGRSSFAVEDFDPGRFAHLTVA